MPCDRKAPYSAGTQLRPSRFRLRHAEPHADSFELASPGHCTADRDGSTLRFHVLRHTNATILLTRSIPRWCKSGQAMPRLASRLSATRMSPRTCGSGWRRGASNCWRKHVTNRQEGSNSPPEEETEAADTWLIPHALWAGSQDGCPTWVPVQVSRRL
jgi:hypothetical protein